MVAPPRTVQLVLAAGRSSRMGRPKALLRFGERTALRLAVEAAAAAGVGASVIVVADAASEVRRAHNLGRLGERCSWVENREEGSEQLRSLQIGLGAVALEEVAAFFIHPVDHPLVLASDYRLLAEALSADSSGATVFLPSHGGRRGHPVLCRAEVGRKILELGPDRTARDAIEGEPIRYVLTPNPGVREDMDTPEDYRRLLERYLGGGG